MGWSLGYDSEHGRDIGYGVPAWCDHPECDERINRGLYFVCGSEPYGGDGGCGLFFCDSHRHFGNEAEVCERCLKGELPFDPSPDHPEWIEWKLTDASWQEWRAENPAEVERLRAMLERLSPGVPTTAAEHAALFRDSAIALGVAMRPAAERMAAAIQAFSAAYLQLAIAEYKRHHGSLPGSDRTARLRKKRRSVALRWFNARVGQLGDRRTTKRTREYKQPA